MGMPETSIGRKVVALHASFARDDFKDIFWTCRGCRIKAEEIDQRELLDREVMHHPCHR